MLRGIRAELTEQVRRPASWLPHRRDIA